MSARITTYRLVGVFLVAFLIISATSVYAQNVDEIIVTIAEKVELTEEQEDAIREMDLAAMEQDASLWYAAARLQQILTDDQKSTMLRDGRQGEPVMRRSANFRPRSQRYVRRGWRGQDVLTEEQREEMREGMREMSEQHHELREQLRNDEIDRETYREQVQALHEEVYTEFEGSLTEEQREELREHREEMEAWRSEYRERWSDREERAQRPRARLGSWSAGDTREQREVMAIYRFISGENHDSAHHRNN